MSTANVMLHRSPDGDRWLLVPWPDHTEHRVVHIASERSGGHIAVFEVDAFLGCSPGAPAVQALRDLFAAPTTVTASLGRSRMPRTAIA